MKNLIIGGISNCDWTYAHNWVESLLEVKDRSTDIVLVYGNPDSASVEYLSKKGVKIHAYEVDTRIAPHVQRFVYMWDYMWKNKEVYNYAVTTDVRDVVFQSNPLTPIYYTHELITASSEEMYYKDEPWGNQNLLETFGPYLHNEWKDWEIFNVGVIGGWATPLRDLLLQIFLTCQGRPISICDQAVFNYLIHSELIEAEIYHTNHEEDWAVQAGTVADPSKLGQFKPKHITKDLEFEIKDGKIWRVGADKPYAIVHQYDRVPEWKELIDKRYKR